MNDLLANDSVMKILLENFFSSVFSALRDTIFLLFRFIFFWAVQL